MKVKEIPTLYYNTGKEDEDAIRALTGARVNCDFIGPIGDLETPMLIYRTMEFIGKKGIYLFIDKYQKETQEE